MPRAIVAYMHCPFCQNPDTKVVDTRESDDGNSIRRRRVCLQCGRRFTTIESTQLLILKRNGDLEPFSRDKVINGVRRACQGRHIDDAALRQLGRQVEERLRASGSAQAASSSFRKSENRGHPSYSQSSNRFRSLAAKYSRSFCAPPLILEIYAGIFQLVQQVAHQIHIGGQDDERRIGHPLHLAVVGEGHTA